MRILTLRLFAFICLCASSAAWASRFRNHPDVVFRPTICGALLGEMIEHNAATDESGRDSMSPHELLKDLAGRLARVEEVSGVLQNREASIQKAPRQIRFDMSTSDPTKTISAVTSRVENLARVTQDISSDQIVWVSTVRGKDAISNRLSNRKLNLIKLQNTVRSELRKIRPEVRPSNVVSTVVLAAMYTFLLQNAVTSAVDLDVRGLLQPLLGYIAGYSAYPHFVKNLQEIGLLPIESFETDSIYDIRYIEHLNTLVSRLEDFKVGDILAFSDITSLSSRQFNAMKKCNSQSPHPHPIDLAASCALGHLTVGEAPFARKAVRALREEEESAARREPKWSSPEMYYDDILMGDPYTGEPILISALRVSAKSELTPPRPRPTDVPSLPRTHSDLNLILGTAPGRP